MNFQTPSQYVENKNKQEQTLFRIKNGVGNYICKDVQIPMNEFHTLFPLKRQVKSIDIRYKGENSDGSKKWMD